MGNGISRRGVIRGLGATGALATPAWVLGAPAVLSGRRGDAPPSDLFSLGVGSGDADSHSVVLWTRLAPDPLNGGGMPDRPVPVRYRLALDPGFRHVVRTGQVPAHPRAGHAVHVQATGLRPDTWYWYEFEALGVRSRPGRTRTFAAPLQHCRGLRFALMSCQDYSAGHYAAYRDLLEQDLDFVVHVGDYIYEYGASGHPLAAGRDHNGAEIFSLADYRNRFALYRLDPQLQEAHARLPFFCTFDDHEVDNNYAATLAEQGAPYQDEQFLIRRRNAYRAYAESMALRPANRVQSRGGGLRIYRDFQFGDLASLFMLDTRQHRSDQPAGDGFGSTDPDAAAIEAVLGEALFDPQGIANPAATLLGSEQERWLAGQLRRSGSRWNVLAQQVMVMPWNLIGAGRAQVQLDPQIPPAQKQAILGLMAQVQDLYNVDAWDGYPAARARLLRLISASGALNPVVLSGDIHAAWSANLLRDFSDPANSDMVAAEFVCTSVTSTFLSDDPAAPDYMVRQSLWDNPHIHYFNGLYRGYCVCDVDHRSWQTAFRAVQAPFPLADSPVGTDRLLRLEAGFSVPGSGKRVTG